MLRQIPEAQTEQEWFRSRPVLLEHMHRLGIINSTSPSLQELEPVVAWDAMGLYQVLRPLRHSSALKVRGDSTKRTKRASHRDNGQP